MLQFDVSWLKTKDLYSCRTITVISIYMSLCSYQLIPKIAEKKLWKSDGIFSQNSAIYSLAPHSYCSCHVRIFIIIPLFITDFMIFLPLYAFIMYMFHLLKYIVLSLIHQLMEVLIQKQSCLWFSLLDFLKEGE